MKRIIRKLLELFAPSRIYVVSDTHFDHKNIIRYCRRPFRNVRQMNNRMVRNWNKTIRKRDNVYFLGDMVFGRGSRKTRYWLQKLNGDVIFIRGSHDRSRRIKFFHHIYLDYNGKRYLLVHDPMDIPSNWKGWTIHGHNHNKEPFINGIKKRINVSVEATSYRPVNMEMIDRLNLDRIYKKKTIRTKTIYKNQV